ncbi:hypothetical protein SDC9_90829 [bioreactor metagenome]|uniref:Uncharacterized protein n=1 Tax=bioreactor metagenome TaxID=1076179 RepID=A0A644ZW58_9ZZZZ
MEVLAIQKVLVVLLLQQIKEQNIFLEVIQVQLNIQLTFLDKIILNGLQIPGI